MKVKISTSVSVVIRIFLWLLMLIGGAWYSVASDYDNPLFRSFYFHICCAAVGFIILVFAFRAASNGGKELSRGRVGDIPRLETNRLVSSGIYSCMRHPMLFGLTLLPLGWALLLGSPTYILYVAPMEMLFIVIMVIVFEEMEVEKKFPTAYDEYRKKVPMISLRLECLKLLFKRG